MESVILLLISLRFSWIIDSFPMWFAVVVVVVLLHISYELLVVGFQSCKMRHNGRAFTYSCSLHTWEHEIKHDIKMSQCFFVLFSVWFFWFFFSSFIAFFLLACVFFQCHHQGEIHYWKSIFGIFSNVLKFIIVNTGAKLNEYKIGGWLFLTGCA